jgi:hypothetical protein
MQQYIKRFTSDFFIWCVFRQLRGFQGETLKYLFSFKAIAAYKIKSRIFCLKAEFNFLNCFWKINKMFKEPTSCAFSGSCHLGYRVMRNFTRIKKSLIWIVQVKLLYGIPLGQIQTDSNNQLIIIANELQTKYLGYERCNLGLVILFKIDYIIPGPIKRRPLYANLKYF